MRDFDAEKTARFFNEVYKRTDSDRSAKPRLHSRDLIFLKHVLPHLSIQARFLDYGCGAGRLLAEMLDQGCNAFGMEKHEDMFKEASLITQGRASLGGIDELSETPTGTYDVVIAMGVFQYLPKDEYYRTLAEFKRILKSGGTLIATYQNALFDLYTFNKYTLDFMTTHFVEPHGESKSLDSSLRELITNPDAPSYSELRARDNIFVHTTNPLTLDKHLEKEGLLVEKKYFYEYFGLPPLIGGEHKEFADMVAKKFEVDNAAAWEGHFMANAFLIHATKSL